MTIVILQFGGLLAVRNRYVSIINSNPLWGPRQNLAVPTGMVITVLIAIVNLYGPAFQVGIEITLNNAFGSSCIRTERLPNCRNSGNVLGNTFCVCVGHIDDG